MSTKVARERFNPGLTDLLNLTKKEINLDINCHHIATIQSFDPAKQTVTATIAYKKTFLERKTSGEYVQVLKEYPILLDCPIVSLSGGTAGLTMPIKKGDTCLILFNDRSIDNWFAGANDGSLASNRLHSFSDGIALVGVRSLSNALEGYDADRAVVYNGTTKVAVGEDKVEIANATDKLGLLLKDLIAQIKLITVTCASPGNPSSVPINAAALTLISTKIEGLLE